MADFRGKSSAPNYLGRREQRRLLTMILLLGLVFYLMFEARKPENWAWMWGGQLPQNPAVEEPAPVRPDEPVDTRLAPPSEEHGIEGSFISPAPLAAVESIDTDYFPGVRPELLKTVRDDTVFRGAEHDAFFHLMNLLEQHQNQHLVKNSRGHAAFVQLFQQPEEYRGQLVTVRGTMRRAVRYPATANVYGIDGYYQTWISPYDNATTPLVAYVLKLPEGLTPAADMRAEVELTGFFYKRWAYRATDTIRTAPMVLARTVTWNRPTAGDKPPPSVGSVAMVVIAGLALGGLVLFTALKRARAPEVPSLTGGRKSELMTRRRVESLHKAELALPVEEALRQLAVEEQSSDEADEHEVPPKISGEE